jgi:hypothetical protein
LLPPILMDRRWWVYRKKSIMNTNKSANIRQSLRYFLGVSIGIARSCLMKQWRRKTSWHCPFKVIVSRVRDAWVESSLVLQTFIWKGIWPIFSIMYFTEFEIRFHPGELHIQ